MEKKPFNIDLAEEYLGFAHGVLMLTVNAVNSGDIDSATNESLAWVLIEAESRLKVIKEMMSDQGLELQKYWNGAHPEEAECRS